VLQLAGDESSESRQRFHAEEARRRKLLDQIHELKGNVRVVCRIRPVLPSDEAHGNVALAVQRVSREIVRIDTRDFEFDEVFGMRASQEDVFEEVRPMVESVLEGHHACIFAYGQTGSGKTHTMAGTPDDRGVNHRSLACLFEMFTAALVAGAMDACTVHVSNVEIYNERVRDLLVPAGSANDLEIRQDLTLGVHLPNVKRTPASSMDEVLDIIAQGNRNRAQGHTDMNAQSSRSHSVVMIDVEIARKDFLAPAHGRLVLVDLAGSERLNKSGVSGERQREAQNINKSLSALGDVIAALGSKQGHVPFRNSKLTYLLQDSLGADNKVMMIVQVAPTLYNAPESACTLAFGARARAVELGKARAKDVRPAPADVERVKRTEQRAAALERQVAETAAKLADVEARAERADLMLAKANERVAAVTAERDEFAAKLALALKPRAVASPQPQPQPAQQQRPAHIPLPAVAAAAIVRQPATSAWRRVPSPRHSTTSNLSRPSLDSLPSPPPRQPMFPPPQQPSLRLPLREATNVFHDAPVKRSFAPAANDEPVAMARRTFFTNGGGGGGNNSAVEERVAKLAAYKLAKENERPRPTWGASGALGGQMPMRVPAGVRR